MSLELTIFGRTLTLEENLEEKCCFKRNIERRGVQSQSVELDEHVP